MSVFRQLTMKRFHSTENYMYATIKGSLTENDGVFSGFSANNYLALQEPFAPEGSWEVCFKVKMGSNVSLAKYFFGSTSYGIVLGNTDTPSGAFKVFLSSNGTSWDIGNLSTGINNPADSIRYVKIGFTGEKYYIEQSEDGITYIGRAELNSTKKIYSVPVRIGNSYEPSNRYWQGAIDLNNSYIKLGSTKYNLQAVVGYTIVGSPTITDGVVSGFSTGNYLQTSSSYTINNMNNDNYEFCIKLTPTSNMGNECYAIKYYNGSTVKGLGISNNKLAWSVGYPTTSGHKGTIRSSFTVTTNTTYWLKGIYKNKIASLYYSLDGTNYTLIESIDETDQTFKITSAFNFGATNGSSYGLFQGSIDMKETYIKINNKLWFNGQQA